MKERKISSIIMAYKKLRESNEDSLLSDCRNAVALSSVIRMAASARGLNGKRHPHQYRLPEILLQDFGNCLERDSALVAASQSFDNLLQIVQNSAPKGIGSLTQYDTAHRIGAFLNLHPTRIYLHQGTRKGVENLLGKIHGPFVLPAHLPAIFQGSGLPPAELEDLFCIYKDRLKQCR